MIVKFHATWCGPCKQVAPIVQELAEDYNEQLVEFDVDESPEWVEKFGVQSVPTIIRLGDDSKEIARVVGAQPKALLAKSLAL